MKLYLLLPLMVLLSGCGRETRDQQELLAKLDSIKTDLAVKPPTPVRWAFANKSEIESALNNWRINQIEASKKNEGLTPTQAEQIERYETLQSQASRMNRLMMQGHNAQRMVNPYLNPYGATSSTSTNVPTQKELDDLNQKVAEARMPVAAILTQREQTSAKFRNQFSVEMLIAEYAKGRYELVVDNSFSSMHDKLLYRSSNEVPDITEGIINLFRQKSQQ